MHEAFRTHDDCEGNVSCGLRLIEDPMGDIYVAVRPNAFASMIRFRTIIGGGGESPHTHEALRNLMNAIDLDNQERPFQAEPEKGA